MKDIIIVGGGAAGLSAAITLKRESNDLNVIILEKLQKPGKKILATGNGRCNLSNTSISNEFYMGDGQIVDTILSSFSSKNCVEFFNSLGVITRVEEGRIYPFSMNAASVLKALMLECEALGVEIKSDEKVVDISASSDAKKRFTIKTESNTYNCDICILAVGGKASAVNGTDGDGYRFLKNLGIKYEPIHPALVQIKTQEDFTHALKGVRLVANISLLTENDEIIQSETGELMFTDYGLSGIPAMQLSSNIAKLTSEGKYPSVVIDLFPEIAPDELMAYLDKRIEYLSDSTSCGAHTLITNVLSGLFCEKVAELIAKLTLACMDSLSDKSSDFNISAFITAVIKNLKLTATGTNGYKDAQVTSGGVPASELCKNSLQSNKIPGLYICGELLNVDGLCGGYNLHFAWGSGIYAAKEAAKNCSE